MERVPPTILLLAVNAFLIAALDVANVLMPDASRGRIFGTLLRDVILVVAGVFVLRRQPWAFWTLIVLFALGLLRVLSSDEWVEYAGVALAAVGLVAGLLPPSRAWIQRKAA